MVLKISLDSRNEAIMLVCNESGNRIVEQPVTKAVVDALKGDKSGFFDGCWSGGTMWQIGERVMKGW